MDGYAVVAAATPGRLALVGEVAMGSTWRGRVQAGGAVAIATGGVVPDGADAVVPIEDVRNVGDAIELSAAVEPGQNVAVAGGDMRSGQTVLPAGRRLGAPELGVLATMGIVLVEVFARPRVAVISSGDELIEPAQTPMIGQIRDSNRYAIAGCLQAMGLEPVSYPIVPDTEGALEATLRLALRQCDGVVLSGGSSVGARDRTPAAIAALGAPGVIVHGLRIKPGKPTVLGCIDGRPIVGLPGNPTSALIVLEAIVAPILAGLTGAAPPVAQELSATAATAMDGREGWTWYLPVALENEGGSLLAHPLPLRSSHVSLPARAAGYVTLGERSFHIDAHQSVRVTRFFTGGDRTA